MGKALVFADGTQVMFTDNSTPTNLFTVVGSYAEVDSIRAKFTDVNLDGATFDGKVLNDYSPVMSTAQAQATGNVTANFINKVNASTEISVLKKEVLQLKAKNETLKNENESLQNENDSLQEENKSLSDKAEAADILLGNKEV